MKSLLKDISERSSVINDILHKGMENSLVDKDQFKYFFAWLNEEVELYERIGMLDIKFKIGHEQESNTEGYKEFLDTHIELDEYGILIPDGYTIYEFIIGLIK